MQICNSVEVMNELIRAVQCRKCLDVIISLYHHDYHTCSCGDIAIDGGRDYVRVGYTDTPPIHLNVRLVGGLTVNDLPQYPKLGLIRTRKMAYDLLFDYTLNKQGKFYRYPKGMMPKRSHD